MRRPACEGGVRVALAGGVGSTRRVLSALVRHGMDVVGVFGFEPMDASHVSGHVSLRPFAAEAGVPFHAFRKLNDEAARIRELAPDILFVVGLSQLVSDEIIGIPTHGCVGFHPTRLPERRGRAPLAWLVLEGAPGAATFFRIDEGIDEGPIYAAAPFELDEDDDAESVSKKLGTAIDRALDEWLPRLREGDLAAVEQDHARASYRGKRAPEDGLIDWSADAESIVRLVRASARPHPGAYTHAENSRVRVWRASVERMLPIRGVTGRVVLRGADDSIVVQSGDGLVRITRFEIIDGDIGLRVGTRLGYRAEEELFRLRHTVARLEARLGRLERLGRDSSASGSSDAP